MVGGDSKSKARRRTTRPSYLRHFPFNKIKIERSFISWLPQNNESTAIVGTVTGLAVTATAEGVQDIAAAQNRPRARLRRHAGLSV
jgi:predicted signal transduction protein with EAL and GGDEF domain